MTRYVRITEPDYLRTQARLRAVEGRQRSVATPQRRPRAVGQGEVTGGGGGGGDHTYQRAMLIGDMTAAVWDDEAGTLTLGEGKGFLKDWTTGVWIPDASASSLSLRGVSTDTMLHTETTLTLDWDDFTGISVGDVAVLFITAWEDHDKDRRPTLLTGWKRKNPTPTVPADGGSINDGDFFTEVWAKTLTGFESGTFNLTFPSSGGSAQAILVVYPNVLKVGNIQFNSEGGTTGLISPAVATTQKNSVVLRYGWARDVDDELFGRDWYATYGSTEVAYTDTGSGTYGLIGLLTSKIETTPGDASYEEWNHDTATITKGFISLAVELDASIPLKNPTQYSLHATPERPIFGRVLTQNGQYEFYPDESRPRRGHCYENLNGYAIASAVNPSSVRCLPKPWTGSAYEIDLEANIIDAIPAFGIRVELGEDDCCDCSVAASASGGGLFITGPVMTNNFVGPAEESGVTIQGGGVHKTSTVKLTIGSMSVIDVTPDDAGAWSWTGSITGSRADAGVVTIQAYELDVSGFSHKPKYHFITYGKAYDSGQLGRVPAAAPIVADLIDSSDTGLSSTDNITSDTLPTFEFETTSIVNLAGPQPKLYIDGVLRVTGDVHEFDANEPYAQLTTTGTALSNGEHYITWTETNDPVSDPAESGHSQPLLITIDPNEGTGLILATALVNQLNGVKVSDSSFGVDAIVITTNTSGGADPDTSPTTVLQPSQPLALNNDDPVTLQYKGGAWTVLRDPAYFRECLIQTDEAGRDTIVHLGPCHSLQTPSEIQALFDAEQEANEEVGS